MLFRSGITSITSQTATAGLRIPLVTEDKLVDASVTTEKLATGAVTVTKGGTGRSTLTSNYVLVGNGESAVSLITPSSTGYILMSNGTISRPSFKAQTNITKLGTITAGTWQGTAIAVDKGGTGSTSGATGLSNLFAAGQTKLSSYQYGSSFPASATTGTLFFKQV